jgi:hypothetical protein
MQFSVSARIVTALAGAILVGGVAFTQAAADKDSSSDTRTVRAVMLFDVEAHSGTTFNVGDNFTTVGRVVSVDGKPFNGRLAFACQLTDAGGGACLYYFYLPGGEVTGTGDVRDDIDFPITGGTGDYAHSSGTVTITHTTETGPRQAVFRLRVP